MKSTVTRLPPGVYLRSWPSHGPGGADCGAVCGVVCGAVRGAGWIGVRERVPGAAARGGALAPRRGRRSGAVSGLRSGRTSERSGLPLEGGGAGLRTGPVQGYVAVRSGPVRGWRRGVPGGRNGAAGRQAGRGGSGAFRRETAGPGRRDTGRPAGGGWNPTRARTTGARSGGAVALPSPRPAVARSPSAPARRLGPTAARAPAASATPVRSHLSPQPVRRLSRSRPPAASAAAARPKPPAQPARTPRAQCPLSPPRVPSAGR